MMKSEPYYVSMDDYLTRPKYDIDGVPLYNVPYTKTWVHYPVDIINHSLALYNDYIYTNKEESKTKLLFLADWLKSHLEDGIWYHHFTLPNYDFKTPWIHGMAQGMGLSLFSRLYQLTKDKKYECSAMAILPSFSKQIGDGGICYATNGEKWYEEYAITPPPHILNGFIFSLFGLYDHYKTFDSKYSKRLFDDGISTLLANISKYDLGYWSKYNLVHDYPAEKRYHLLHVYQLKALYDMTSNQIFGDVCYRWQYCYNQMKYRFKVHMIRMQIHLKRHGVVECVYRGLKK